MTAKRKATPRKRTTGKVYGSRAEATSAGVLAGEAAYAAIAEAHVKVAAGKVGSVKNGATVPIGLVGGTIREPGGNVWANLIWKARHGEVESIPDAFYPTTILRLNPLHVVAEAGSYPRGEGTVKVRRVELRYSGSEVAALREAYAEYRKS